MHIAENLDNKIKELWPKDGPPAQEINKYIKKYSKEKIVIKCGGRVLLDPDLFSNFINDIAILKKLELTPIVIHGGGPRIKKKLDELNIETKFIMGLRVTDEKVIKIVEDVMVEFNKEIVAALEKKICKAKSITIKENNAIYVEQKNKELGYVGKITEVDSKLIKNLIKENFIPVISPMGLDQKKQAYNINADTFAGAIASELGAAKLIMMTDVEGVMDSAARLVPRLTSGEALKMLADGSISGGMIPKIETCVSAIQGETEAAHILDGRVPHVLLLEIFTEHGIGTMIKSE